MKKSFYVKFLKISFDTTGCSDEHFMDFNLENVAKCLF